MCHQWKHPPKPEPLASCPLALALLAIGFASALSSSLGGWVGNVVAETVAPTDKVVKR